MTRPRVVIVGLGDTGVLTAIALRRYADVVGITATPEFVSGQELGLRLARPEAWERDCRIAYRRPPRGRREAAAASVIEWSIPITFSQVGAPVYAHV